MPGYRDLAHNHDFTVLWVGQTVSELGSRVSMFVFPLIAYALTGSALLAGLTESAHLLGTALALLPGGVLSDRFHRRRLMRTASGAGVVLYSSLAAATAVGELTLGHLLVVAFGTGLAAGVFAPAEMSAVRSVVAEGDLPTALAQNQARQHVASLVGGPLGGALYAVTRWLPFAADAVSFAVSWVLLGRIRTDLHAPAARDHRPTARSQLVEGSRFILRRPFFRTLLVWSPLTNLAVNALSLVAVLRLIQAGYPPVAIGLVETAAGACGILGAVLAPRLIDRFATGWLTVLVGWSWVPFAIPMVFVNDPAAAAAALSLGMLLNPVGNAGIGAYRLAVTPAPLVGRVQSVMQFASYTTLPVAPLLAGLALTHLGGPGAVTALVALTAGVALIPTLSRTVRSVPRPDAWSSHSAAESRLGA